MRVKKKGQAGQAKNFLTRTHAVRKLQISLPDFRRLCIFKGIYPREPRNKRKASKSSTASTTFYYTKDIQYLLHEPLLAKFRDHKALAKKIARSLGRGEVGDAVRLEKQGASGPGKLSLDHIIKERYPTFVDALRDLDDALSLLFLFASLPSTSTVPPKTIALCQRLCLEFQHYLITTNSLRKSFLSIKGIYYQATIQGQDILWLVPYKFVQRVTGDVDFRIMGTFVEFYTTLLGFVNFRLYTSIGLVYPPRFDSKRDEEGAELDAFTLEGKGIDELPRVKAPINGNLENGPEISQKLDEDIQKQIAIISNEDEEMQKQIATITNEVKTTEPQAKSQAPTGDEPTDTTTDEIDVFPAPASDADTLLQPAASSTDLATLFDSFTFYISRECPRAPLEFLLRAFGCKRIGWDAVLGPGAFTHDESNPRITHQVVDRPPIPSNVSSVSSDASSIEGNTIEDADGENQPRMVGGAVRPGYRVPGRTYIQPQWVWDSINTVKCLRPDLYAPGATLPPHLSPWMKPGKGQYDPTASLAEQEREGEAEETEGLAVDEGDEDGAEEEGMKGQNGVRLEDVSAVHEDDEHGMTVGVASDTDEEDDEDDNDADRHFTGFDSPQNAAINPNEGTDDDDDEEIEEEDQTTAQHQQELAAEAAGLPFPNISAATTTKADGTPLKSILKSSVPSHQPIKPATTSRNTTTNQAAKNRQKLKQEEEEELTRRKMMLGTRKRKLVERMLFSNDKKEGEAKRLRGKRRRIEVAAAAAAAGGKGGERM